MNARGNDLLANVHTLSVCQRKKPALKRAGFACIQHHMSRAQWDNARKFTPPLNDVRLRQGNPLKCCAVA